MEVKCRNGYRFFASEASGRTFRENQPYLRCPYCGELVFVGNDFLRHVVLELSEHNKKLNEISNRLSSIGDEDFKKRLEYLDSVKKKKEKWFQKS